MDDTEMQDPSTEAEPLPPITLDVFQFVRIAQSQHGLKHYDYARYRQYCKHKLHRARRHLKIQHGKGKFVRKKQDEDSILTSAQLQVPLVNAERSWAHAMEAKGQLEGEHKAQVRQNVLRKLNKAAAHASEFSRFASKRGTARTALEAEAYAEHLNGLALLEHPTRRAAALVHLQKAKKLCEQLAAVGSLQQQAAAQQRLDEVEPLARFAQHQLRQSNQEDVPTTPTTPNLGGKFAQLKTESLAAPGEAGTVSGPAYLQWRGNTYPAYGERQKVHIHAAEQLGPDLSRSEGTDGETAILEKISSALNEAKGLIRHALATSGGSGADSADALDDLKALNTAVTGKQLELTIRRNRILALQSEKVLDSKALPQIPDSSKRKGKKARGQGPANVVRQYDALIQNLKELSEVAGQLGGAAGEYLLDDCSAMTAEFQAKRCFFVGRLYLADRKQKEAHALFARAEERCRQAVTAHEDCAKPNTAAIKSLEAQEVLSAAWKVVAHAQALEQQEKLAKGVQDISLEAHQIRVHEKYLLDDLESWKSYAGNDSEPARLAPIPPRLQLLQAKPFLLDCALDYIKPPDLSHRIPKEEKKSAIGRLFGWGAR